MYEPTTLSFSGTYAGLTDVALSALSANQISIYNSGTSKWNNATLSLASGLISDVNITSPSLNQILKYDGTNWVNGASSGGVSTLASLTDVSLGLYQPLANAQNLQYDSISGKWVNNSTSQTLYYYQVYGGIEYWSPLGVQQNVTVTNQPCHIYPFFTPTAN